LNNEKTTGMILFNPGIITTGVPEITRYLNLIFPFARVSAKQFTKRDFRETFLKRSFIDPSIVTDEVVDEIMLGVRSEGYMDGTTSMMKKYYVSNELELLSLLDLPTLIVFGQEDRNKSVDEAIALNENIKGSKLNLIENAGHYVHEEAPEKVTKRIIKEINYLSAQGKIKT
jgi:pimeloyl-ACP methyl ester carboxylesterase